ncbi:g3818 [Coccomyxa elongata]
MNSKQSAALLLCALFVASCLYTSTAIDCNNPSNCGLCSYCSRRGECPNGDGTQQGRDACSCAYQCNSGCRSPICQGRRRMLGEDESAVPEWADLKPEMIF